DVLAEHEPAASDHEASYHPPTSSRGAVAPVERDRLGPRPSFFLSPPSTVPCACYHFLRGRSSSQSAAPAGNRRRPTIGSRRARSAEPGQIAGRQDESRGGRHLGLC